MRFLPGWPRTLKWSTVLQLGATCCTMLAYRLLSTPATRAIMTTYTETKNSEAVLPKAALM